MGSFAVYFPRAVCKKGGQSKSGALETPTIVDGARVA
jgi:hypothetical protein